MAPQQTVPGNLCQAPASSKVSTPPLASSPHKPARTLKPHLREALSPESKSARPLHQQWVLGRGGQHVPSDTKGATRSLSTQSQSETGTEGEKGLHFKQQFIETGEKRTQQDTMTAEP